MLLIFSGNGKGKTSAAAGIAFRSWGQGRKVLFLAFLKSRWKSGEFKAIDKIKDEGFILHAYGRDCLYGEQDCCPGHSECILRKDDIEEKDFIQIENGLETLEREIQAGYWDLIIADEILNIWNSFPQYQQRIQEAVMMRGMNTDLLLTGRSCPDYLRKEADIYSTIESWKHPFFEGLSARRGIDY